MARAACRDLLALAVSPASKRALAGAYGALGRTARRLARAASDSDAASAAGATNEAGRWEEA